MNVRTVAARTTWDLSDRALAAAAHLNAAHSMLNALKDDLAALSLRLEHDIPLPREWSQVRELLEAAGTEHSPLSFDDRRAIVEVALSNDLRLDAEETDLFRWAPNRRLSKARWTRLAKIDGLAGIHWCTDEEAGWLAAVPEHIAKVAREFDALVADRRAKPDAGPGSHDE